MDRILFLDAEFVDNQEVIELSICNLAGKEVFHSYFKPADIDEWPVSVEIHKITPECVKNAPKFADCRRKIQKIFDKAEYIVGFATQGDINHLSKAGIQGLSKKRIIDIKNIFWLYYSRELSLDYYGVPGLIRCAEHLGVSFGDTGAHSASGDTIATLNCFHILASNIEGYDAKNPSYTNFCTTINKLSKKFIEARDKYDRMKAHGWIHIYNLGNRVYKVVFKRAPAPASSELTDEVEVEDIFKAEQELLKRLSKKSLVNRRNCYRLSQNDIDFIRAYSNEFSPIDDHVLTKKLLQLQKHYR